MERTLTTEEAIERVDLAERILSRKELGFDISPEDETRAKELGLDMRAIEALIGDLYAEDTDEE